MNKKNRNKKKGIMNSLFSLLVEYYFPFEIIVIITIAICLYFNLTRSYSYIEMSQLNVEEFPQLRTSEYEKHYRMYLARKCAMFDFNRKTIEYNFDNIECSKQHYNLSGNYQLKYSESSNSFKTYSKIKSLYARNTLSKLIFRDISYLNFLNKTEILNEKSHISFNKIDSIINSMGYTNIMFNAPNNISLNDEHPIALLASNAITQKRLEVKLDSILGRENIDSMEFHKIKAGTFMEAQLTGQHFTVSTGSPVRQPLRNMGITKWEWMVKPTDPGIRYLVLTVNAILTIDGKEKPYTIQTFRKPIKVEVSNKVFTFFEKYQNWILGILGLIFTFLAVYFGHWLSNREKTENVDDDEEIGNASTQNITEKE